MASSSTCPMCDGALVESGMVEEVGLIFMCDNDTCQSHSEQYDCQHCGHRTAFVWVSQNTSRDEEGRWELRCFDPLCKRS